MAIKKSDLYSSIWASCDELRGGMDAGQYKDYVLFMLFIKYISDKYGNSDEFAPAVVIPRGASFKDMVALKGDSDIGNKINTRIVQPLIDANSGLARSDFPDFNDPNKLGDGLARVERLGNLIAIFENPALDFSQNRAEHDDILGDAYEYLMRHFATESGKSKGQFYTPSEVSRVIAKALGILPENTVASTTAYDPTCGSGSLLLKVAAEAGKHITLEGQEKDSTTAGLVRMNMILHDFPTAHIASGGEGTLVKPRFLDGEQLRTYDYVVANPPFSDKTWSTGLTLGESGEGDRYKRFAWGVPPRKQGDYAYLLHIVRSMKSTGKAACVLPHGVLFRGNAEATIRRNLVRSGILKGIIGLPANLFYGTGIPACILVLDKENAQTRQGIFMIDASKGYRKDGAKNRLRDQDIHKIVDTFRKQDERDPRYARMVPITEIADPKNDYNLNLPRYIDSTEPEDLQDIDGHLRGGIPERDLDVLSAYWQIMPALREALFESLRPGYARLKLPLAEVKPAILGHAEFTAFQTRVSGLFDRWRATCRPTMTGFGQDGHPKALIETLSESLLAEVEGIFEAEREAQQQEQRPKKEGSTKAENVFETKESSHGREETRRVYSLEAPEWLYQKQEWSHLRSLIMVEAKRELSDQVSFERRYYLASLEPDARRAADAVRGHWGIENSSHWILDVAFDEDDSRARAGNAPENLALVRKLTHNLLQQEKTLKRGIQTKRLKAGWDRSYLLKILNVKPSDS